MNQLGLPQERRAHASTRGEALRASHVHIERRHVARHHRGDFQTPHGIRRPDLEHDALLLRLAGAEHDFFESAAAAAAGLHEIDRSQGLVQDPFAAHHLVVHDLLAVGDVRSVVGRQHAERETAHADHRRENVLPPVLQLHRHGDRESPEGSSNELPKQNRLMDSTDSLGRGLGRREN